MEEFDKRLVTLVNKAMESANDKEEMSRICYQLARVCCFLHAQEFGNDNGKRLMYRVTDKIFEEIAADRPN